MHLGPGTMLTPGLRLVRPIGAGGMGSVWIAEHLALRTHVAVKLMDPRVGADPGLRARFAAEAAAAARIKSPHVAQVFDYGVAEGAAFIVMELLQGEDLATRIARRGPLPPYEVAHLVRQACRALAAAHAMGIVHRDIKPANIFVLDHHGEPFVKVLDFGLAKDAAAPRTGSGALLGTPHYLSPEQAESARAATPQSDLWSLGVVIYQCLTGVLPFPQDSLMPMLLAIKEARFPSLASLRPDLPPPFDMFMRRALARDPAHRFSSAIEMTEAFDRAVTLPPSTGPVVSQPRTAPPRAPSSGAGLVLGLGALALFLFVGVGLAGFWFYEKSGSDPTRAAVTADSKDPANALVEPSARPSATSRPSASEVPSSPPSAPTNVVPLIPPKKVDAGVVVAADAGVVEAGAPDAGTVAEGGAPKTRSMFVGMALGQGVVDDGVLRSAANARIGQVNGCFALLSPDLTAIQEYTLKVEPSGAVSSVASVTGKSLGATDTCMFGVLRGIALGKPKKADGGNVLVGFAARL